MLKRKQITFDLDTNVLKQIYGEKNYTKAYSDIRSFMEDNDFEHIEGSVYASKNAMNNHEILEIIDKLKEEHEYLDKCVKNMHQTDIGESHSLTGQFNYDGTPGKFAQKDRETTAPNTSNAKTDESENKPVVKSSALSRRFAAAENLTANISDCQASDSTDYKHF